MEQKPQVRGFLRGKTIELYPSSAEHYPLYIHWENNDTVRKYSRNIFPQTLEMMKKMIEEAKMNPAPPEVFFEIQFLENHQPIGFVGLHHISWVDRTAKIGLIIGEMEFWNKGIGTEASQLILQYGFEELNLNKIYADIFNISSIGSLTCAKKSGMKLEATLKDDCFVQGKYIDNVIYSLLANDWYQSKKGSF